MSKLDSIDITLLRMLQNNARCTLKDMAKAVDLSTPAVSSRLDKLERRKIVKGYTVMTNSALIGLAIDAYVFVDVPSSCRTEFVDYINSQPFVTSLDWVTGSYSAILRALFIDTNSLGVFTNYLSQRYGKTVTQIILNSEVERRSVDPGIEMSAYPAE